MDQLLKAAYEVELDSNRLLMRHMQEQIAGLTSLVLALGFHPPITPEDVQKALDGKVRIIESE